MTDSLTEALEKTKSKKQIKEELAKNIAEVEQAGYVVHKPQPPVPVYDFDIGRVKGNTFRIGIVSDTHIGSKFQQLSYLKEHVAYMKKRKCVAIMHAGDITDGSTKMHPGFEYELFLQTADAQMEYAVEHLPNVGIPWFLIGGNHDASHWKSAGVDVPAAIAKARDDFTYLGPGGENSRHSVGFWQFGDVRIQLAHPHLGGTRQRSYRMELWIEALQPETLPNVVIMGNFHKVLDMDYRNVFGLMVPSYQAQTAWGASKGISSYIGGCILEFGSEPRGLSPSITVEWLIERMPRDHDW